MRLLRGLNEIRHVTGQVQCQADNKQLFENVLCVCVFFFLNCFSLSNSQFIAMLLSPDGNLVIVEFICLKTQRSCSLFKLWALESDTKALHASELYDLGQFA